MKQIVPFCNAEESQTLKCLGFDEKCFGYISENEKFSNQLGITNSKLDRISKDYSSKFKGQLPERFACPTYDQAFNWFEKECDITLHRKMVFIDGELWEVYCNGEWMKSVRILESDSQIHMRNHLLFGAILESLHKVSHS